MKIPAVQQISVEAAGQLLLQAAFDSCLNKVAELLAVPAVTQLATALLREILQAILEFRSSERSNLYDLAHIPSILALPAAAGLSADAVAKLVLLVIDRLEQERGNDEERQNSCWQTSCCSRLRPSSSWFIAQS